MPFRIVQQDHYLHVVWCGVLTRADLGDLLRALPEAARLCGFRPDVLHTFDELTSGEIGAGDVHEFSLRRRRTPIPAMVKSAIVADTPFSRGMARMFQGLNRNPSIVMEVFPSAAEAVAWLAEGKAGTV